VARAESLNLENYGIAITQPHHISYP